MNLTHVEHHAIQKIQEAELIMNPFPHIIDSQESNLIKLLYPQPVSDWEASHTCA